MLVALRTVAPDRLDSCAECSLNVLMQVGPSARLLPPASAPLERRRRHLVPLLGRYHQVVVQARLRRDSGAAPETVRLARDLIVVAGDVSAVATIAVVTVTMFLILH
jgi:hypothetical protein